MTFKYKITLSFNGGEFQGWQDQGKSVHSVQRAIETYLSNNLGEEIKLQGCSRTDKGVSAKSYTASFLSSKITFNELFIPHIKVHKLKLVHKSFNPQMNIDFKQYKYYLGDLCSPNEFNGYQVYKIPYPIHINLELINTWINLFKGIKSYKYLSVNGNRSPKHKRRVKIKFKDLSTDKYQLYEFDFKAKGFLKYMIRMIIGSLILVLQKKLKLTDLKDSLEIEKEIISYKAPATGLTLVQVKYLEENL